MASIMCGSGPWLSSTSNKWNGYCFYFALLAVTMFKVSCGQNYSHHTAIYRDKLDSSVYNIDIPPLIDQTRTMKVMVAFELLSIVQVDEISQSFVCNGVLPTFWYDELLIWNSSDYGGKEIIHPRTSQVWSPMFVLVNTLGDRDIFADDDSTIGITNNGYVTWFPGSLFTTACELDMTYYPYDEQTCYIELSVMGYSSEELAFTSIHPNVGISSFMKGGEWDFINGDVIILNYTSAEYGGVSGIKIAFQIRRNPLIVIIVIVLPVVFLSFMNLLVFIIPVDSGEKIGYGMAVLLSLSVFMSVISAMLPRASDPVPIITIYLFSLLVMSLFTVIDSVIIVKLHHMEDREDKQLKEVANLKKKTDIFTNSKRTVSPFLGLSKSPSENVGNSQFTSTSTSSSNEVKLHETEDTKSSYNKYKTLGKYIDTVSFVIFFSIWLSLTLAFMVTISGSPSMEKNEKQ